MADVCNTAVVNPVLSIKLIILPFTLNLAVLPEKQLYHDAPYVDIVPPAYAALLPLNRTVSPDATVILGGGVISYCTPKLSI